MRIAAAAILLATGVACGGGGEPRWPGIRLGEDACSTCRMTISETTAAAVATGPGDRVARFDDLACLARHLAGEAGPWRVRVHALDSGEWIDLQDAWIVRSSNRITPMGSNLLPFASREAAELHRSNGTAPLRWPEHELEEGATAPPDSGGGVSPRDDHLNTTGS